MTVVSAEISEDGKRVEVYFKFDWKMLERMKKVPGAKFKGKEDVKPPDVPHWVLPLDVDSLRILRREVVDEGAEFRLGPKLKNWGRKKVTHGNKLRSLATADHAELTRLWDVAPRLARALFIGPLGKDPEALGYPNTEAGLDQMMADMKAGTIDLSYLSHMTPEAREALRESMKHGSYQQADVAFMAHEGTDDAPHSPANFNQPGTGKTLEVIGAILEAGLPPEGCVLVSAPKVAIQSVWARELEAWGDGRPVLFAEEGRDKRSVLMEWVEYYYQNDEGFWLVVNPEMIRCKEVDGEMIPYWPLLHQINWNWLVVDEFHMCGLTKRSSLTRRSFDLTTSKRRLPTSGTPIGGQAMKLWPVLNFCRPDVFTAEWRFADQWFDVFTMDVAGTERKRKEVGDLREDRLDDFWKMLSQYAVRRTKEEAAPWTLPKSHIIVKATMTGEQETQYAKFAIAAEIKIDEENLSALGILAEYTRLKQFAQAACRIVPANTPSGIRLIPKIETSCKLPHVMQLLAERGISKDPELAGGDEQVVIFSQFSETINALTEYLQGLGFAAEKITGDVTQARRLELERSFQAEGGCRILCMNSKAGGVAITLDRASTAIFLDEDWNPDTQEQALDRLHRASKIHQVTGYYIRTEDSIEDDIHSVVLEKDDVNFKILDARRLGLRADRKFRNASEV